MIVQLLVLAHLLAVQLLISATIASTETKLSTPNLHWVPYPSYSVISNHRKHILWYMKFRANVRVDTTARLLRSCLFICATMKKRLKTLSKSVTISLNGSSKATYGCKFAFRTIKAVTLIIVFSWGFFPAFKFVELDKNTILILFKATTTTSWPMS